MIHQVGALRRPAGLLSVSWTVTGSIKIKQDTTLDQDIVTIPVADWPALRNAVDAAIEARQNIQGADAVSEAQSLTTKLDAHADWLEHVKDMPKNAELIREAVARIKQLEVAMTQTLGPLERCGLLAVADNVRVVIGTNTTLGGTTSPNEKARNP